MSNTSSCNELDAGMMHMQPGDGMHRSSSLSSALSPNVGNMDGIAAGNQTATPLHCCDTSISGARLIIRAVVAANTQALA